jgi:tRNA threonylcarbamoyladenosine biosynthesis protein TsaE
VLLLEGDLGAGKTCLVQGLAEGLGIEEPITSPTFALAQHYDGRRPAGPTALVHLDLYRLEQVAAADELFLQEEEEALALGAVLAVEWPERLSFVPAGAWRVRLEIPADGEEAGRRAIVRPPPGLLVPSSP